MGKSQRTKGAVFEREVCDAFYNALGRKFARNIGQARDGGNDIDVGPLVVECKRRATLGTVYSWLQQAIKAAKGRRTRTPERTVALLKGEAQPLIPVVVARQDGDTSPIVILRLSDFLILTRDELQAHFPADEPVPAIEPPCRSEFVTAYGEELTCMAGRKGHEGSHHAVTGGARYTWG